LRTWATPGACSRCSTRSWVPARRCLTRDHGPLIGAPTNRGWDVVRLI
jgi:hypothetical protein